MTGTIRLGFGALAWAGLVYAVLGLRLLPGDYTHSFCGPWGCLPPLQAVVAMHGFWILVVVPPTAWAIRTCPRRARRAIGLSLMAVGVLGITIIVAWESWTWTHRYGAGWKDYLPQRLAIATVTTTDFPLLQILAAGIVLSVAARRDAGNGRVIGSIESDERKVP